MNTYTPAQIAEIVTLVIAALPADEPAAPAKKAARKAPAKAPAKPKAKKAPAKRAKAPAPKRTDRTREDLSRKEWNRAVTGLARSQGAHKSGVSVYRVVCDQWAAVQELRAEGATPAEAVGYVTL